MAGWTVRRLLVGTVLGLLLACPAFSEEEAAEKPKVDPGEMVVSFEARGDDFVLRQYELHSLAHLSYLVGSGSEGVVIDPQRDVEPYLRDAQALGLQITKVILTHTHTDFVAGHVELQARAGAALVTAKDLDLGWARFDLGSLTVRIRPLEGGPRDGLILHVCREKVPDAPSFAFTGDTLLVGTVGCPEDADFGVPSMNLAEQAFDAIEALKLLSGETKILPAHGAGHFCGRMLEPYTVTTLARERVTNPFLTVGSRAAFLGRLLDQQPPTPASFAPIARMNRAGPPPVDWEARPPPIEAADLPSIAEAWLVDLRSQEAYAEGHVLGALNMPATGPFESWVAAVVPPGAPLHLVGEEQVLRTAVRRLHRVGYSVQGVLDGGMAAWAAAGRPVERCALIGPRDFARRRAAGIEPLVLDVRSAGAYRARRIADGVNVPLEDHARFARLLLPHTRCLMVCKTGYRSSIAVGLAERMGFRGADNLAGGIQAWKEAGLPLLPAAPGGGTKRGDDGTSHGFEGPSAR